MIAMDKDEIRELLKRYYDAETSESEEARLREYLLGDEVDEEFLVDRNMMRALQDSLLSWSMRLK